MRKEGVPFGSVQGMFDKNDYSLIVNKKRAFCVPCMRHHCYKKQCSHGVVCRIHCKEGWCQAEQLKQFTNKLKLHKAATQHPGFYGGEKYEW